LCLCLCGCVCANHPSFLCMLSLCFSLCVSLPLLLPPPLPLPLPLPLLPNRSLSCTFPLTHPLHVSLISSSVSPPHPPSLPLPPSETNDDLVPTVPHLELSSRGGGGDDGADKDAHDEDAGKDAKSEDVVISVDSAAAAGINADGNVKVLETPADTQSSRAPSAEFLKADSRGRTLVRSDSGEYLDRPFEFVRPRSSSRNPPPTGEKSRTHRNASHTNSHSYPLSLPRS